jgi:hypothetical protein
MLKTINSVKIKLVNIPKIDPNNIVGYELFPEIYSNIFIVAKKKSGKTNVIFNIIEKCVDKNSTVIVFCNTYAKDSAWLAIQKYLDDKKIPNLFYSGIAEGNENHLASLLGMMANDVEEIPKEEKPEPFIDFGDKIIKVRIKKPKKISQKYLIIFDDVSSELKDHGVATLLKQNRHYKARVIISTQWPLDISPPSRRQMQYYLLFGGLNDEKLEELYRNSDLNISFEKYLELYKFATAEKYNFFYIDTDHKYRVKFNKEFVIPE